MMITKLSQKQKRLLTWPYSDEYKALVCDGAVRSGKTVVMTTGFILWAMMTFDGQNFGICGKTVASAERNIIMPAQDNEALQDAFRLQYKQSSHVLTVTGAGRENYFYVFGGKDESSYALIQGITLAGILFDEVALMPKSFVDQGIARTLSVPTAKLWFNCNPESPAHWFYSDWIKGADDRRALHLHFRMEDNPIMSPGAIAEAERMYTGVFYQRYILGLWVIAEGLVYPNFDATRHVVQEVPQEGLYYISVDYGTLNPCSMGLWCVTGTEAVRVDEYYWDGRQRQQQKTDEEYYTDLEALAGDRMIQDVIVDPSAASFLTTVRRHGRFRVTGADNRVLDGIRYTSTLLTAGRIKIAESCKDIQREFLAYAWDDKAGKDAVIKANDHAMDDMRYFVMTILARYYRW